MNVSLHHQESLLVYHPHKQEWEGLRQPNESMEKKSEQTAPGIAWKADEERPGGAGRVRERKAMGGHGKAGRRPGERSERNRTVHVQELIIDGGRGRMRDRARTMGLDEKSVCTDLPFCIRSIS